MDDKTYIILKWVKYHLINSSDTVWEICSVVAKGLSEQEGKNTLELLQRHCVDQFTMYTVQEIIKPS